MTVMMKLLEFISSFIGVYLRALGPGGIRTIATDWGDNYTFTYIFSDEFSFMSIPSLKTSKYSLYMYILLREPPVVSCKIPI